MVTALVHYCSCLQGLSEGGVGLLRGEGGVEREKETYCVLIIALLITAGYVILVRTWSAEKPTHEKRQDARNNTQTLSKVVDKALRTHSHKHTSMRTQTHTYYTQAQIPDLAYFPFPY